MREFGNYRIVSNEYFQGFQAYIGRAISGGKHICLEHHQDFDSSEVPSTPAGGKEVIIIIRPSG